VVEATEPSVVVHAEPLSVVEAPACTADEAAPPIVEEAAAISEEEEEAAAWADVGAVLWWSR